MHSDQNATHDKVTCPHCKNEVPWAKHCPLCGQILPKPERNWKLGKLSPVEIFLAVLGSIMLLVALIAL